MKKFLKRGTFILIIILIIVIILGIIFFSIDYNRVKNNELPIFCVLKGTLLDGGTKVYYGLGYKVIKYNRLSGYNKIHIGSWFMDYNNNIPKD